MLTLSTDERLRGRRQRHRRARGRELLRAARCSRRQLWRAATKPLQLRDRELDRRQRPRAQDRARDDDAGGRLLLDHQIGADAEHRRLQHHAQHLGDRAEAAGDVGWRAGCRPDSCSLASPQRCARRAAMPIAMQHLGVAPAGLGERVARAPQAPMASSAGARVMNSVSRVSATRMSAPTSAVDADQGWNRKQMAR